MKKIIFKFFDLLSLPLAYIWNEKVAFLYNTLMCRMYARIIGCRLKGAKNLCVYASPVMIRGAKKISVGDNVEIGVYARIDAITSYQKTGQRFNPDFRIGNNVVINANCHIGCINKVEIGEYTTIGARTYITDHTHGTVEFEDLKLPPRHRKLYSKGPVIIGKYVTIGEGCAIMPGVIIGDHAVIGANAVVTKDIPPYSVAAGNPAKVLKQVLVDK
jgi:acetyltransferase-like isoleucine patch superfamily enzyme